MSQEKRREMIQKALAAAVDGARIATIEDASARLESGADGVSLDQTKSFMMQGFIRSTYTANS